MSSTRGALSAFAACVCLLLFGAAPGWPASPQLSLDQEESAAANPNLGDEAGSFARLETTAPAPGVTAVKVKTPALLASAVHRQTVSGGIVSGRATANSAVVPTEAVMVPEPTGLVLATALGLVLLAIVQRFRSSRVRLRESAGVSLRF